MANRVASPNLFAPANPNWSLALLDQNAQNATGAINDSSLGSVNGPLGDTGGVNAYVVTCSFGTPSAYNNGMTVFFTPGNSNTGASTLTVSPLGSLPIVSASGSALTGGELQAGAAVGVVCDGSAFRIVSQPVAPQFGAMRLRSFNAIGNPNFEVDQRNVGNAIANPTQGIFVADRWQVSKNLATGVLSSQCLSSTYPSMFLAPGTNFAISQKRLYLTLTTQQASLASGEYFLIRQFVEGPMFRELSKDVHSITVYANCSVPLNFGIYLRDSPATQSLVCLCSMPVANTWYAIQLPNLPVWPAASTNFTCSPGSVGYEIGISLAAGSSVTAPTANIWNATSYLGVSGQDNFFSKAVNTTTLSLAFIQHEPGSQCTTLIDCPFGVNLDGPMGCQRYFQKSYPYATGIGTVSSAGLRAFVQSQSGTNVTGANPFHKPMAKTPTITLYNHATGIAGSVRDAGGTDHASASAYNIGDSGFGGVQFTTATVAAYQIYFNYTADTGW